MLGSSSYGTAIAKEACCYCRGTLGPDLDIVETLAEKENFTTFFATLEVTDLIESWNNNNGTFTVFAPTDLAFEKIPRDVWTCLQKPENNKSLSSILQYHIVTETISTCGTDFTEGEQVATSLNGQTVTIELFSDGGITIFDRDGQEIATDAFYLTANGVIHAIDSPLFPPDFTTDDLTCDCLNIPGWIDLGT